MQHSPEEIKRQLLCCIDQDYNVTDMAACLAIISILERTSITREVLEATRLGKHINEIRKQTNHPELNRRTKDLVRKWRREVMAEDVNGVASSGGGRLTPGGGRSPSSLPSSAHTSPAALMGSATLSSARGLSPATVRAYGPATTIRSPAVTPPHSAPLRSRGRRGAGPPEADPSYAPGAENVAKTNAANKRLRKEGTSRVFSNGHDDGLSRDSFSSIISLDRSSSNGDEIQIVATKPGIAKPQPQQSKSLSQLPSQSQKKFNQKVASPHRSDGSPMRDLGPLQNRPPSLGDANSTATQPSLKHKRQGTRKRKSHLLSRQETENNVDATDADFLKKKAALAAKATKVKTTRQLVEELAERKGDSDLAERATKIEVRELDLPILNRSEREVARNKMEHLQRFLKSKPEPEDDDEIEVVDQDEDSLQCDPSRPGSPFQEKTEPMGIPSHLDLLGVKSYETAEEILSRLPPIDVDQIVWDDPEEDFDQDQSSDSEDELTEAEKVERLTERASQVNPELVENLHENNADCMNGNADMDGRFREWHEVSNQKAYRDTPLVLLPYVITDF